MPLALGAAFALLTLALAWRARRQEHAVAREVALGMATLAPVGMLLAGLEPLALAVLLVPLLTLHRAGQRAVVTEHQALHDALTGLPNRALFTDRVERALQGARRDGGRVVLMLLDLDRFKEVNDTLGHHHGDALLRQVGPRLAGVLRSSDTVARLGGDEFAVLLPSAPGASAGAEVGDKLLQALRRPFGLGDVEVEVDASLGIAAFPDDGQDVETLVRHADAAMYAAKAGGGGGAERWSRERDGGRDPLAVAGDLRRAIERGELEVVYQPKVHLRTGAVGGVEALVRWRHPERGLVLPSSFVEQAEHTGLMRPLTLHVLEEALTQLRTWAAGGLRLRVAVNLSARGLLDRGLADDVAAVLERCGVRPAALELEVTEATIMADPSRAAEVLRDLAALGVGLSLDDFGTGWSSLGALERLPVDEIKIDRSFVVGLGRGRGGGGAVVRSAIDLGRNLDLRVVAEGVEDEHARRRLAKLGCDLGQGYHFSPPIDGPSLAEWARRRSAPPAAAVA
jgi:diguanylate cyclase (GGDEF)-like protein